MKKLRTFGLSRVKIKQRICGVVLHPPNCNAGELVCIGPGRGNIGLESQPGRELLFALWRSNDGSMMTKCVEKKAFEKSQSDKEGSVTQ